MKKYIFVLSILLSACCSTEPNFYQPVATKYENVASDKFNNTILINQIILPSEIARPQIISLGKYDYEIRVDEFNRWASQPEKMFQRVINENLSNLLPNALIENQTVLRKNYKYAIAIEIQDLNGRLDEKSYLDANYYIKDKRNNIIKSGKFNKTIAINDGYSAYIPAISNLLGELSKNIANDIINIK
ncbi:MAG: membrane integrity-associated transporter subunit PqiC [Alphaproteobacteria bacterium]|nr:membrane integrity-associated transporter subunit PqiC [Alphaproteobacteria bacterium]